MAQTFPTQLDEILERIRHLDPEKYAGTRNFKDGAVSRLSPYISRGVISTRQVMEHIRGLNLPFHRVEKLIQELAWRDYWQEVWRARGAEIDHDLKHPQTDVDHHQVPKGIMLGRTGIEAIDSGIEELKETGYMHNHMRMYVAFLACNLGRSHWLQPARWMYYHLLDGDWASNALSWQWVAGSNSNKKYIANQDNINTYFYSQQKGSYLDISYEELALADIPEQLMETSLPDLRTELPDAVPLKIDPGRPTLVYNYYNLDPQWRTERAYNRVLLLEPSVFKRYPVSKRALDFAIELSTNIEDIQLFSGEFQELKNIIGEGEIIFKEHPLNTPTYEGTEDSRDWMFEPKGYQRSFFAFWKKCKKELSDWDEKNLGSE